MCLGINVKCYSLVWMSAADEKQIPAGTARTLHPDCVWCTWVELYGRDLTEFIAQVPLGPLLLCNFSWSHLIYFGSSILPSEIPLSTVTLIPPFLLYHTKNKWQRNSFYYQSLLLMLVQGYQGWHPHASSLCSVGMPECILWACLPWG